MNNTTIPENKKWEYMEKDIYCMLKISEVILYLPNSYSSLVYDRALQKYGIELDLGDIRKVKNGHSKNKMIADLINEIGKEFKR